MPNLEMMSVRDAVEIACDLQYHVQHPEIIKMLNTAGDNPAELTKILRHFRKIS